MSLIWQPPAENQMARRPVPEEPRYSQENEDRETLRVALGESMVHLDCLLDHLRAIAEVLKRDAEADAVLRDFEGLNLRVTEMVLREGGRL